MSTNAKIRIFSIRRAQNFEAKNEQVVQELHARDTRDGNISLHMHAVRLRWQRSAGISANSS
jgi:hypothetical protein